jgi:hypothetical protein
VADVDHPPNPSFTRGEYWLLETVVPHVVPLCFLSGDGVGTQFNKPSHGLPREQLVDCLERLLSRCLIEVVVGKDHAIQSPTRQDLQSALDHPESRDDSHLSYRLSSQGGLAWEAFAQPEWDRYVYDYGTTTDGPPWESHRICADKRLLQRILAGLHYVGYTIDPGSVVWSVERPWQATYWKELPLGHRASYQLLDESGFSSWHEVPLSYYRDYDPKWYRWK